jgi:hypothetical protein
VYKGQTYYIRSDAYPRFAKRILKKAVTARNPIREANKLARTEGFRTSWITKMSKAEGKEWLSDRIHREHGYKIKNRKLFGR